MRPGVRREALLLALSVCSVVAFGAQGHKQGNAISVSRAAVVDPPRTISVSGTAVGEIPIDTVVWTVGLEATGKDLAEAEAAGKRRADSILTICAEHGIQACDIDVGQVLIRDTRQMDGNKDAGSRFRVSRAVTFRQRRAEDFSETLQCLRRRRGARVRYVMVGSKEDEITQKTFVRATQAAKDKASAMAKVVGARLGKALEINEYPPSDWNVRQDQVPVDEASGALGMDVEEITVTVYVTFELDY